MIVVKEGNEFVEFGNRAWIEDQKIFMGNEIYESILHKNFKNE